MFSFFKKIKRNNDSNRLFNGDSIRELVPIGSSSFLTPLSVVTDETRLTKTAVGDNLGASSSYNDNNNDNNNSSRSDRNGRNLG